MAMTLTIKQIAYICDLAGIEYKQPNPDDLSIEITIEDNMEIQEEGKLYKGLGAYITDYPEEGAISLEDE
ncbi:hypothetical protein FE392_17995 [Xenorhabdus sp. 12]|uniref:Phage protein n=1 Tax=Xenorhabdus santafensis TaxID=2582833 RepID=A0ABU4SEF0_9GAMM|nr:hypothetical protein [Xenorhabdus sp. 12]MDX7989178.1 hypothetical protein [Xenorhabdus sp. 12]